MPPDQLQQPRVSLAANPPDLAPLWRRLCTAPVAALVVIAVVLGLATLAVYAIDHHRTAESSRRAAETARYLARFEAPPVRDAWQRLRRAWQIEAPRQQRLLDALTGLDGVARQAVLADHRHLVIETVEHYGLRPDLQTMLDYFRQLAVCVRVGNCERDRVAGQLGEAVWQLRHQHYHHFAAEGSLVEIDRHAWIIAPPSRAPLGPLTMPRDRRMTVPPARHHPRHAPDDHSSAGGLSRATGTDGAGASAGRSRRGS